MDLTDVLIADAIWLAIGEPLHERSRMRFEAAVEALASCECLAPAERDAWLARHKRVEDARKLQASYVIHPGGPAEPFFGRAEAVSSTCLSVGETKRSELGITSVSLSPDRTVVRWNAAVTRGGRSGCNVGDDFELVLDVDLQDMPTRSFRFWSQGDGLDCGLFAIENETGDHGHIPAPIAQMLGTADQGGTTIPLDEVSRSDIVDARLSAMYRSVSDRFWIEGKPSAESDHLSAACEEINALAANGLISQELSLDWQNRVDRIASAATLPTAVDRSRFSGAVDHLTLLIEGLHESHSEDDFQRFSSAAATLESLQLITSRVREELFSKANSVELLNFSEPNDAFDSGTETFARGLYVVDGFFGSFFEGERGCMFVEWSRQKPAAAWDRGTELDNESSATLRASADLPRLRSVSNGVTKHFKILAQCVLTPFGDGETFGMAKLDVGDNEFPSRLKLRFDRPSLEFEITRG